MEASVRQPLEWRAGFRPGKSRYFFVALGVLFIAIAIAGFGPSFYEYFTGAFYFPPIVHVHGALMIGWLALYATQAGLASRRNLDLHRRLGVAATVLAPLLWSSMFVATIVAFKRHEPDGEMSFMTAVLLIQLGLIMLFPVFVTWGLLARRRAQWHKRMMTFASLILLQAAVDRMHWLPDEGLPMFWHHGLRLYILMIPLFVFDFVSLRRIHPATLICAGLTVAMHTIVSAYWADAGWNALARAFWIWIRGPA